MQSQSIVLLLSTTNNDDTIIMKFKELFRLWHHMIQLIRDPSGTAHLADLAPPPTKNVKNMPASTMISSNHERTPRIITCGVRSFVHVAAQEPLLQQLLTHFQRSYL